MNNVIQTYQLSYSYGHNTILNGLNLEVPEGNIYGYLGCNGAGKTTTLKLLLGLLTPRSGTIEVAGCDIKANSSIFFQIGNLIESPTLYDYMSAREQLCYLDHYYGLGRQRIDYILDLVGLRVAQDKKIKHFSAGMKQRLGIGMALFNDPSLLILDEPINGLDPNGVYEVRELLLDLNREFGKTILLSSHILSEIEKISSYVGILHNGELLFQGEIDTLLSNTVREVVVTTSSIDNNPQLPKQFTQLSDNTFVCNIESEIQYAVMIKEFSKLGIDIYNIEKKSISLEDVYIRLTSLDNKQKL